MSQGEMPAGPNMAALTSMGMGGGSAMGQAQCRPLFWLPNMDAKSICTPSEMMQFKADKKVVPGAEQIAFMATLSPDSIPVLGWLLKILKEAGAFSFDIANNAGDLQDAMDTLRNAQAGDVQGVDAGQMMAARANITQNYAASQAAIGGSGIG